MGQEKQEGPLISSTNLVEIDAVLKEFWDKAKVPWDGDCMRSPAAWALDNRRVRFAQRGNNRDRARKLFAFRGRPRRPALCECCGAMLFAGECYSCNADRAAGERFLVVHGPLNFAGGSDAN